MCSSDLITKNGDPWATVTLEDLEGAIEVLLFPSAYRLAAPYLTEDAIIRVRGQLDTDREPAQLRGQEVTVPDLERGSDGPVVISLPSSRCTGPVVAQLREVLSSHAGLTEVRLQLLSRDSTKLMRLGDNLRVTPSVSLFADLKPPLGPGCLDR
mgnify:FL=1